MEDMKLKAKQKVLEQIMEMMEGKELEGLKSKSPKFMKVETNDPEMAKEVVEGLEDKMPEMEEKPMMEELESEEFPDEDLEKLKELYAKLK
jgi:hypothetical protein